MKKNFCKKCLLALCTGISLCANVAAQGWVNVGIPNFTASGPIYVPLAIDSSGTPYMAYDDTASANKANVMKFNGASWVMVGSADFSAGGTVDGISLAINRSGTPYVAFADQSIGRKATVMKYNGTSWVIVGSAGFSAGSAATLDNAYPVIAIDGSGTPYVAYQDGSTSTHAATVMKFNGASWVTVGSPSFSAAEADGLSLAIDGSGTPYVAYDDWSVGQKATVMKYNGTSWVTVGSAGFTAGSMTNLPCLALNSSGTPYVTYSETVNNKAMVMMYNGSSWVTVGGAGFSSGEVYQPTIAINGSGIPYVAYADRNSPYSGHVMMYNGSSWVSVGGASFSDSTIQQTTIALNGSSTPYVAYGSVNPGSSYGAYEISVVKYVCTAATPAITHTGSTLTSTTAADYQWYLDGSPIAGATNASYHAADTGSYTVKVTDTAGCSGTSAIYDLHTLSVTSVGNMDKDISIYPNPAQNNITLTASIPVNDVEITNIVGQVVFSDVCNANKVVINMEQLPPGLYLVKINNSSIHKVVKQ